MYSLGFKNGGLLLAVILGICLSTSLTVSGSVSGKRPVAERRFFGDWFGGKKEEQPPPPQEGYGAGFGMYPLWKFHKFDGFSLRPVPMNLDVGYGIPPPPPTYTPPYPPQQAYGGGGGYEQQQPYEQQQYGQPQQQYPQVPPPQQYGQNSQPPAYGGQNSYDQAPIQISYQPVPTYQQQSNYGPPPQQNYPQQDMSYSPSAAVATTVPAGGYGVGVPKVPSYSAFEGQVPFSGLKAMEMPKEAQLGGFVKRNYDIKSGAPEVHSQPPLSSEGVKTSSTT